MATTKKVQRYKLRPGAAIHDPRKRGGTEVYMSTKDGNGRPRLDGGDAFTEDEVPFPLDGQRHKFVTIEDWNVKFKHIYDRMRRQEQAKRQKRRGYRDREMRPEVDRSSRPRRHHGPPTEEDLEKAAELDD